MRAAPARDRALFLTERAFKIVSRHGTLQRIHNAGIGREFRGAGYSIWYAERETSACDEFHHLDKGEVCKTSVQRFGSVRRLQSHGMPPEREVITIEELSTWLQCSVATAYSMAQRSNLAAFKAGRD